MNQNEFENMLTDHRERTGNEMELDWNEDDKTVAVKCTGELCHYYVSYHYAIVNKVIDRPDKFWK